MQRGEETAFWKTGERPHITASEEVTRNVALFILSRPRPQCTPDHDLPISLHIKCLAPQGAGPAEAKVSNLSVPGAQSGSISFQKLTAGRRLPDSARDGGDLADASLRGCDRITDRGKTPQCRETPRADPRWRELRLPGNNLSAAESFALLSSR